MVGELRKVKEEDAFTVTDVNMEHHPGTSATKTFALTVYDGRIQQQNFSPSLIIHAKIMYPVSISTYFPS